MGSQTALEARHPLVDERLVPERLGAIGETLTVEDAEPEHREVRLADLLEDGELAGLVEAHGDRLGGARAPIAASLWANYLVTVASPSVLGAWTLFDLGIDAGPTSLSLHLVDGLPRRVRVAPDAWRQGRPDRELGPRSLLASMDAVFEELEAGTGVQRGVLDNHVGNVAAYLFDRLEENQLHGSTPQADRAALLDEATLPWGDPNPLQDPVRYEPLEADGLPDTYQVRRECCLKVTVDGKPPCASCPTIDAERRAQLLRERRDDP